MTNQKWHRRLCSCLLRWCRDHSFLFHIRESTLPPFRGTQPFLLSRLSSGISLLEGGPGDVVFPRLLVLLVNWVNARTTLALVLPHPARLMDYIAAWWVACQLRPGPVSRSAAYVHLTAVIFFTDDRRWDAPHTALPGRRPLPGSVSRTERRRHLPDA